MLRTEEVTAEVVSTVADRKRVSEETLPPLYDSIEPNALAELYEHADNASDTELLVKFSYAGHRITIEGPGEIYIEE